ncbi:MAG: phosphate ABC transporter substrate-binding protein PstS [Cyanobacteria bacterium]|nr:phosphate ABC transporter substrate-binding protein PstS [Cyanobacteria bacterium CG_2015-16_32_12]NCO78035.1 phosphate ABC transporter substrate-binding protein PstS [Cyanobacteria bacterium CG_2015-22_32_23]NCQ05173.1 phosphate ABC transporter substrate-binding protein PstS [Cyanobacteria bacterium CG_2015-09_32_10]NCQ43089.1 phosphate ABC transporter substrate-binding protein PstS [Cyanobacteria bacterium CG_2015-04_32_10]NCS83704.1 phosphate ABC transporter substrate-binding protein PstS
MIIKSKNKLAGSLSILALGLSLTACGGGTKETTTTKTPTEGETQESSASITVPFENTVALTGAGASFPAPLYQNWFVALNQKVPKLQVNYQSVGSGAGVEQFTAGTVDFGASDTAMKDEEIAKVSKGALMLPVTAGSIVFAYNLPGVEGLKLSRETYVDIALGKITKWNDPKIVADNPDLTLPDKPITFVHRSDGSGTTGVFTKHLSAISEDWKTKVGEGKTVQWGPDGGKFLGGKGNEGVTATIMQNEGAIGYVEYGYAKNNKLHMAAIQNKAGQFIPPTDEAASETLANVELPENLRAFITDPEGETSYPIVTYSWILAFPKYDDPNKAIAVEAMIQYALTEGQKSAPALGYVPLPATVVEKVAAVADQITPDFTINVN